MGEDNEEGWECRGRGGGGNGEGGRWRDVEEERIGNDGGGGGII